MKKNNCGLTLIEVIISMALLGIIVSLAFSFLEYGNRVSAKTGDEYQLQASMRLASQKTMQIAKNSSAMFTITRDTFSDLNNLTNDWDYIGVSDDKREVIQYIYNASLMPRHRKVVLVESRPNMFYEMQFVKGNNYDVDKLLKVVILGYMNNFDGAPTLTIETELECSNSLQVIDRGSGTDVAAALAYRSGIRPSAVTAAFVFVMDNSGSMGNNLGGSTRINILKSKTKTMVESFAQRMNVDVALVPFSTSGNDPGGFLNANSQLTTLKTNINNQTANGGTNTGDGLRRGYHRIVEYGNSHPASNYDVRNYMVVLVDGVSTFASVISDANRNFVVGDANLTNLSFLDRGGTIDPNGQIAGNGSLLDTKATEYVNTIGTLIKAHGANTSKVKVYVIGFSDVSTELDSVDDIATACGSTNVFRATSETELNAALTQIQKEIAADLWQAEGPK